jgi:nicotinamide riboside kinase
VGYENQGEVLSSGTVGGGWSVTLKESWSKSGSSKKGIGMSKLLVVNLYAGPGAGKSTVAAGVFHNIKKLHISAELIGEYAKNVVWRGDLTTLGDQIYVLGKQHHRQFVLEGKCDVAVTDSPILLSCIYNKMYTNYLNLESLALEAFHRYDNLNFVIQRESDYHAEGRVQNEEDARRVDVSLVDFLHRIDVPYTTVTLDSAIPTIVGTVQKRLGLA